MNLPADSPIELRISSNPTMNITKDMIDVAIASARK